MKKIFSCLLLLTASYNLHAQLVVPTNIIAQPGDFFKVHTVEYPELINPGDSGINQTWDMTNIEVNTSQFIMHETMAATATPHHTFFPSSNLVDRYYSSDEPGDPTYKYYFLNDTTLNYYSLGSKGTQIMFTYSNPQMLFHFPFGYNNTSSDNYCFSSDILGTGYNYCGNSTITFDGVGTLKLPYGDYTSVYRFKYLDETVEAGSPTDTTRHERYYWYQSNTHYPLFTYDIFQASNGNTFVSGTMLSASSANAVKEVEAKIDVVAYPNPTNDFLSVDVSAFANTNAVVTLVSIDGRTVKELTVSEASVEKIDLTGVAPGVYTMVISNESKVARKMIVKS